MCSRGHISVLWRTVFLNAGIFAKHGGNPFLRTVRHVSGAEFTQSGRCSRMCVRMSHIEEKRTNFNFRSALCFYLSSGLKTYLFVPPYQIFARYMKTGVFEISRIVHCIFSCATLCATRWCDAPYMCTRSSSVVGRRGILTHTPSGACRQKERCCWKLSKHTPGN